jgi:hypothetical protein
MTLNHKVPLWSKENACNQATDCYRKIGCCFSFPHVVGSHQMKQPSSISRFVSRARVGTRKSTTRRVSHLRSTFSLLPFLLQLTSLSLSCVGCCLGQYPRSTCRSGRSRGPCPRRSVGHCWASFRRPSTTEATRVHEMRRPRGSRRPRRQSAHRGLLGYAAHAQFAPCSGKTPACRQRPSRWWSRAGEKLRIAYLV